MRLFGKVRIAGAATLLILSAPAFADDAVAPLDLSPSRPDVDYAPTGAIKPQPLPTPHSGISPLDFAPAVEAPLPPEAPAFEPAPFRPIAAPASDPPPVTHAALSPPALPLPPPEAEPPAPTPVPAASPSPAATPETPPPAQPAETAPTDPQAVALKAALDEFVAAKIVGRPIGAGNWDGARKAVAAVYAERGYAPLWLDGDRWNPHALSALARLARADEDGLNLAAPQNADGGVSADVALSAAVVAYALQASGSRLNPRGLSPDVTARAEVADPAYALKTVAAADDPGATLEAFNPPQPGYRALRSALAELRGEAAPAVARFRIGPPLKLGMSDPRVPLIRARFGLGPLKGAGQDSGEVYDVRVASAVAAFQRVHGLPVNGALTEATASALDGGGGGATGARERLILANMEMWRWEPREMGETRVEVNVPEFELRLMRGETVIHRARVVVGKPDTPTPIFSNSIKYMLFNPVWHVPDSIIKKEMEPAAQNDPAYFTRHGYKVTYVGSKMVVEQPPGEANALGRMLFLFPNEHAVYLHDTPARGVFGAGYRALSHGCVRVEDPAKLAEMLMGGAARGWTDGRVRALLGDKERTVGLPVPVPIHLQYFTAFVDEGGRLEERSDLYGLTAKVEGALAALRRD